MTISRSLYAALATGISIVALAAPAEAQAQTRSYDIPAGDLAGALDSFARQSGVQIVYKVDEMRGKRSRAVSGSYDAGEALRRLLAGTGFEARRDSSGAYAVVKVGNGESGGGGVIDASSGDADDGGAETIVVTGSRIRGAPPASPVIRVTQRDMQNAGQTDLGQVARSIPQNFGGGQNPTVAPGSSRPGDQNNNSASTLNLRGLGGDATLTLLNGHRLAYNGSTASVDISSIPIVAVDRLEVVADGASAIYGSDAVGGVANVVLKRDFEGLHTSARLGGSTDGGNEQWQLSAVGGSVWSSGGILAAMDLGRSGSIQAGDRSYTSANNPALTLVPEQHHRSGVLAGHQQLGVGTSFEFDGVYTRRSSANVSPSTLSGPYTENGSYLDMNLEALVLSSRIKQDLGGDWQISGQFTYGEDVARLNLTFNFASTAILRYSTINDNSMISGEINAEGPLWQTSAGSARLAIGAGYRRAGFDVYTVSNSAVIADLSTSRDSYYGYAEIFVPIMDPAQDVPGVYRFSLTSAVRYEDYRSLGSIATPRLGVVYAPTADVELKGSWGKSFKTPTLYQQYNPPSAPFLMHPSYFGSSVPYPPTASVIQVNGTVPDIRPEKATTWSATATFQPKGMPGVRIEASYFNVDYRDRIIVPITSYTGTLENPAYQFLITRNPTLAQINEAIAGLPPGFQNLSAFPYDPANVVAILDTRYRNVATWKAEGVDIQFSYRHQRSAGGSLTANLLATYMKSSQQLTPGEPDIRLAGTAFNPPDWRVRAGLTWEDDGLTVASYINYADSVVDERTPVFAHVGSMTTADFTVRYEVDSAGILDGLELALTVQNAFNATPSPLRGNVTSPAYDSTNYSAVGRFIGITVGKRW